MVNNFMADHCMVKHFYGGYLILIEDFRHQSINQIFNF